MFTIEMVSARNETNIPMTTMILWTFGFCRSATTEHCSASSSSQGAGVRVSVERTRKAKAKGICGSETEKVYSAFALRMPAKSVCVIRRHHGSS